MATGFRALLQRVIGAEHPVHASARRPMRVELVCTRFFPGEIAIEFEGEDDAGLCVWTLYADQTSDDAGITSLTHAVRQGVTTRTNVPLRQIPSMLEGLAMTILNPQAYGESPVPSRDSAKSYRIMPLANDPWGWALQMRTWFIWETIQKGPSRAGLMEYLRKTTGVDLWIEQA